MRAHLLGQQRGAAMVFGIFFAVFLLAMLWYVSGLSDTLLYRQHLQDAADSAAFSAAVVHARGMNLLALINMTMAAVLSVLVGLRLAETLGLVAIGICAGLAWVTGGSTLAAVPPLTRAVKQVHDVADKVEKALPSLLSPLHAAGKAVSVVVPLGSNLRVVDLVTHEYEDTKLGMALPARLTLPIEDDSFTLLCRKAGQLAGSVAILPLMPVLPSRVEAGVRDIAGRIAGADPDWFCGGSGDPPDLNADEDSRIIEYPLLASQRECHALSERGARGADDDAAQARLEQVCQQAALEYMASLPNRAGQCRAGEPLCPTACEGTRDRSCPPEYFKDCTNEEAAKFARVARESGVSDTVTCGSRTPDGRFDYTKAQTFQSYERRLMEARSQCDPTDPKNANKRGHAWLEREVIYTSVYDPKLGWLLDPDATEYGKQLLVEQGNRGHREPCADLRQATAYESKDLRLPVCQGDRRCLTPQYTDPYDYEAPCAQPAKLTKGWPLTQREAVRQVTDIVRCVEEENLTQHAVAPMNVTQSLEESKQSGSANTSPFRLEKGVWLGGSELQVRAVVIGHAPPAEADAVVGLATWGAKKDDAFDAELADRLRVLGQLSLAQAEYYFDAAGLSPAPADPMSAEDVSEWLWHMAWRARLRPFRLDQTRADGPKPEAELGPDAEQERLLPDPAPKLGELVCMTGAESDCARAKQGLELLGEGEP